MAYFKGVLTAITALFLAECVPGSWSIFKGISQEKATGLAAVVGGFFEALFSPLFWIVAWLFFAIFFAAGRLANRALRILLFWLPTITCSTLALTILALFGVLLIGLAFHAR
jgi:hypothetical protein